MNGPPHVRSGVPDPSGSTAYPIEGRRVLIVDDNEAVCATLQAMLESHGVFVQVALDGHDALETIAQEHPDLILSDINMNHLGGFELLNHVRQDPETVHIPFILMTGRANFRSLRSGMSLGADDYLPKPFSTEELLTTIRYRLERHDTAQRDAEARMSRLRDSISLLLPHELLTPLNGILGVAALLETGDVPDEELPTYADMLRESGERLHRLTLNFLTLARLEILTHDPAGRRRLTRETCSTHDDWLQRCARDVASRWEREHDLVVHVTPLSIRVARQDLEKAVDEILDNAFKFSTPGTPVELVCEELQERVQISIRDLGRGMQKAHIENIGAFLQFDRRLHEQQGSGLGMIIAHRLIDVHGGKLAIESELDAGTLVKVLLRQA